MRAQNRQPPPARRSRRFPDSLVLVFGLVVVAQLATYVLPAGEFERDGQQVIAGTYQRVETEPLPPFAFLASIPAGLSAAQDIIFFVFIVGGVIAVIRATGAVDALIGTAIQHLGSRPVTLIGGMVLLFALGSSTIGMAEEYLPFVPIFVSMCLALRMDAVVAVGIIYVGAGVGYGCAALNPFTVLIAQDIAGVALTSGQGFRWLLLLVCTVVGVHHLLTYVRRIARAPESSFVGDVDYASGFQMPEDVRLTRSRIVVLSVFGAAVGLFVYGVAAREWYLTELTAILLGVALVAALVGRLGPNTVATVFCRGAAGVDHDSATDWLCPHDPGRPLGCPGDRHCHQRAGGAPPNAPVGCGSGRDACGSDGVQFLHPIGVWTGVRDDADHGAARRSDVANASDCGARVSVWRWVHQHDRTH